MRRNSLIALGIALAAAGCGSDTTAAGLELSRIRVVHASPDAPNLDIYLDGNREAANVPYAGASNYLPVIFGTRVVELTATGSQTPLIQSALPVAQGTDYTLLAVNRLASIQALVLTDDNSAPAAGQAKLRIIHAAPSAPAIDVYATAPGADLASATPQIGGLAFRSASTYLSVAAGDYRVRVTQAGTKTVLFDSGTLPLGAGVIRTIVAVDHAGGGGPVGALLLTDRL